MIAFSGRIAVMILRISYFWLGRAVRRLVEDQHVGIVQQGLGNPDARL
jgi:hypothetical protein